MDRPAIAAVTMVYNEPVFLPLWLRHYAAQVGIEHCYVVDHGSEDGSTNDLGGANRLRLPRSPLDEVRRARFISEFAGSLLEWYDWVIHVDVDELVFADPAIAPTLAAYAATSTQQQITAFGFNLVHAAEDAPLDLAAPILPQRPWFSFATSVTKPVLTRRKPSWSIGFHLADSPSVFGDLYLIHLRFMDRDLALQRLAKTRRQAYADDACNLHQRQDDDDQIRMLNFLARQPRDDTPLHAGAPKLRAAIAASFGAPGAPPRYEMTNDPNQLWHIPARFRRVF